jgi:hypothetical protein
VTLQVPAGGDRRNKRRVQIAEAVRVRPSEPIGEGFDEVQATINVCRDGIYFPTNLKSYRKGMRVFVTFPYSEMPGAINLEYIGEVVRVDKLTFGRLGVAVHLKSTMNTQGSDGYRHVNTGFK